MSSLKVYCDFDGTVATKDVGRQLFQHFAGPRTQEIAQHYVDGTITARECLLSEAALVSGVGATELSAFVDQFTVDEHFSPFRDFCSQRNIPVTILSDGLDFYVDRILRRYGLADCRFFANHLEFVEVDGVSKFEVTFPYTDSECILCGNCKRNHMLTLSSDNDIIVYVGDGISDKCPAGYADIVFAKKDLIQYCQQENITYSEYKDFRDVQQGLEHMMSKKRIKKRREAEMARRDVFMQG